MLLPSIKINFGHISNLRYDQIGQLHQQTKQTRAFDFLSGISSGFEELSLQHDFVKLTKMIRTSHLVNNNRSCH